MGAEEEVNARAHFADIPSLGGLCPMTLPPSRQPGAKWAHTVVTGPLEGGWDSPSQIQPQARLRRASCPPDPAGSKRDNVPLRPQQSQRTEMSEPRAGAREYCACRPFTWLRTGGGETRDARAE